MWTLLKSEIKYNAGLFFLIALICLTFTVLGLLDLELFKSGSFLEKYFWTIIISVGSYFIIFVYWSIRTVEKRDRLSVLLPLRKSELFFIRYLTGVVPFLIIASYIELNRLFLPGDWYVYIERISAQLSMLFIFLSLFAIAMEFQLKAKFQSTGRNVINFIILFNLIAASIALYTLDGFSYLPQMGQLEGRLYFYIWGMITSFTAVRVFYRRSSYTD
jgi:hypothetical protein